MTTPDQHAAMIVAAADLGDARERIESARQEVAYVEGLGGLAIEIGALRDRLDELRRRLVHSGKTKPAL